MQKTIDAVAAGHMCLDITPVFPDTGRRAITEILCPGKLINMNPAKVSLGGPVSNTGLALQKYGLRLAAITGVGDDEFGAIALKLLAEHNAAGAIRPAPGAPTSYTVVLAPPGIDRMFLHCPGKNDTFRAADIDFESVKQARLFHLGYPPLMKALYENEGAELIEVFRRAKQCDVTTSLDMSLPDPSSPSGQAPWTRILEKLLPHIDIFMPSIEEIFFMLERDAYMALKQKYPQDDLIEHVGVADFRRLAEKALAMGCGICVIKTGRRGYYLRSGTAGRFETFGAAARPGEGSWDRRELWAPAYKVTKIASATGSGDSSIAGFLAAYLRGLAPERCMRLACASGHHNLRELDALSGLPDWAGLTAFVDGDHPSEDPLLDAADFTWDAATQTYRGRRDGAAD